MTRNTPHVTGVESYFDRDEIIVSKTDTRGRLTYVNKTFIRVSGYTEDELIGQPHSMIRHPQMPRTVFKLLWEKIEGGHEIFAYVKNLCKSGDHYWVFAHVTPTFDSQRNIVGYHSNRRVPRREALKAIEPLYETLAAEERRTGDRKADLASATKLLETTLNQKGLSYDEFVLAF